MTIAAEINAPVSSGKAVLRQWELVDKVRAYNPAADEALLNKAYVFSVQAHGKQLRHSGDPYYAHPIEVAGILTGLKMDTASVCTALLHDVLEDTPTTFGEMADMFGGEIARLVQGVTKLSQLELSGEVSKQAENFQKFVLAMSKDLRVLLVKLCDRLHNMRTLQYHPKPESRERIARETMEIYAPLARRIGVDKICSELEDLSFFYMNPSAYESITTRLNEWRESRAGVISQTSVMLRDLMDKHPTAIKACKRQLSARIIGGSSCKFVQSVWTMWPSAVWRRIGPIRAEVTHLTLIALKRPAAIRSAVFALWSRLWSMAGTPMSFWKTPSWTCLQTRFSRLRPKVI